MDGRMKEWMDEWRNGSMKEGKKDALHQFVFKHVVVLTPDSSFHPSVDSYGEGLEERIQQTVGDDDRETVNVYSKKSQPNPTSMHISSNPLEKG